MIGRGRSAEVWLVDGPAGRRVEKVFVGDWISNAVQRLATGAPHPYRWNEDAAGATLERRRILAALLPYWFGSRLAMADGLDVVWRPEDRAFALVTEFAEGGLAPLLHPLRPEDDAGPYLWSRLMPALQRRLTDAGFFGIVWQAGLGNPKALSNYLYDRRTGRYVFVDAESGVPAIFAVAPSSWRFYAAMIRRFGRPMMDDVDCARLRGYLRAHEAALAAHLGSAAAVEALLGRVGRLEALQERWHSLSRAARRRAAAERIGRTPRAKLGTRIGQGASLLRRLGAAIWSRIDVRDAGRFVASQDYRTALGESYVLGRLDRWRARGQLSPDDAATLRAHLAREREAGRYLTDFGAHLGMKASFFALEVLALAALAAMGLPLYLLGLVVVLDGPIYRTLYTLYRSVQNVGAGRPVLWAALAVGVIPFFGTLAFPAQMLWSATGERDEAARFVVYDTFSRLAVATPLVGGEDTALEHRLNRAARRLLGA
jgi:hypothetical protein